MFAAGETPRVEVKRSDWRKQGLAVCKCGWGMKRIPIIGNICLPRSLLHQQPETDGAVHFFHQSPCSSAACPFVPKSTKCYRDVNLILFSMPFSPKQQPGVPTYLGPSRPDYDMTFAVDWALKSNYLSIYLSVCLSGYLSVYLSVYRPTYLSTDLGPKSTRNTTA